MPNDWQQTGSLRADPRTDNRSTPAAPGNFRVSSTGMAWNAVNESDIVGYRIYSVSRSGSTTRIASVPVDRGTSYSQQSSAGARYVITAVNIAGRESPHSASGKTPQSNSVEAPQSEPEPEE